MSWMWALSSWLSSLFDIFINRARLYIKEKLDEMQWNIQKCPNIEYCSWNWKSKSWWTREKDRSNDLKKVRARVIDGHCKAENQFQKTRTLRTIKTRRTEQRKHWQATRWKGGLLRASLRKMFQIWSLLEMLL